MRSVYDRSILRACCCPAAVATTPARRRASRAVAGTPPRFGDADPHDWSGIVPWQYPVHGIDVSKYQGDIDWSAVRRAGIDFAFIKATEGGDHADDRFLDNWAGARAAGDAARRLPLLLLLPAGARAGGLVHQPRAARRRSPLPPGPRPRVDPQVEDLHLPPRRGHRAVARRGSSCGADRLLRQAAGHLHDGRLLPRQRALAARRLSLLAALGRRAPVGGLSRPALAFWQYTGTGLVEGIDGPTDLNVFAGSPGQMESWAQSG